MSLGRWTYVAFVLVLGYCINICLETFDVTGVTNVATNALVGNLPAGVCDCVRARVRTSYVRLGRWTSGLFVLVLWYCIKIRVQTSDVTDVTNVAMNTHALVPGGGR